MMTRSRSRTRGATRKVLPAVVSATLALFASAGAAAAVTGSGPGKPLVSVAQGSGSGPLAAATLVGSTDPTTEVDVSIILKAQHLAALEGRVQAGWGANHLTAQQFAQGYGGSPAVISGIEGYLQKFGIKTAAYGDRLDISATGTAGEFNKAFGISLQNFRVKSSGPTRNSPTRTTTVYGTRRDPKVPAAVGNPILAILGLTNYTPFTSQAVPAVKHAISSRTPASAALPPGELAPADFVKGYGLSALEARGAKGQGETIGIVTLAAIDPSVPLAFWNKYLGLNEPASRLTVVPVDGGGPAPSGAIGSDETDLDVEQSGAIAPKAKVRVYEAPNTDPGFADAFFAAASDNIADTVSVSWGESDTLAQELIASGKETPAYAAVFDEAYLELAAQGQSNFAATGDYGGYQAVSDAATTNLAVGNPGDSPYVTAAGGTTLPGTQTYGVTNSAGAVTSTESVDIPAERAWSTDYFWPLYRVLGVASETAAATSFIGGSNGGYSTLEPRPSYQQGLSGYNDREYLTPTDYSEQAPGIVLPTAFAYTAAPPLRAGWQASGRAVPDVSTDADPQTGYAVYDPAIFASTGGFAQFGGTSFVAPQLNGATAVIDSYVGHRVGFWNPQIYRLADTSYSPFTPLNSTTVYSGKPYLYQTGSNGKNYMLPGEFSNNNLFYTGKPGSTWNPATGLGTPNLTKLAFEFARLH